MNIELIVVGKTDSEPLREMISIYEKRLNHYTRFNITVIPDIRNTRSLSAESQSCRECEQILRGINSGDFVVLLDERGEEFRSVDFAGWLSKRMGSGLKRLVFVIGGPYGFSKELYDRADSKISLSRMTFSHQLIRALFTEQLYRAFSILGNEPYHHQ